MKTQILAAVLCVALFASADAATRRGRRPGTSTVPPKSKMIVLPPLPPIPAVRDRDPGSEIISTDLSGRDLQFFTSSIEAGLLVAALGELAKTRAEAGVIKDVGSALAHTQTDENRQLVRLASLKGVTLSTAAPARQAALTADLEKLAGSNFDKGCMDGIIAAAKDSVAAYEGAGESRDGDIKNFTEQMLPIAKEKLRLAEKMTGAGTKAAKALFRTGAKPAGAPVATPAPVVAPIPPPTK